MRELRIIFVLIAAVVLNGAGVSSAQDARAEPRASGIAGSSLSVQGPGSIGKDEPTIGVAPPRQVVAAIKDRVTVQNTLRRRWEAAGPDERKKMLDLQRTLSDRRAKRVDAADRKEVLDRMNARTRVAVSPGEISPRVITKPPSGASFFSDGQRRALRERVRDLSPEQRQDLRTRISELDAMNEVDQAILREQLQQWVNLPEGDRAQMDSYRERWESMTPEEQDVLRNRMLRLREMNADQRQDLLNRTLDESLNE
ncbi:MAG: DUF3106 domain-containing protein [Myxococcota bacterium]|nr:hypothetical protein [Spirochaeta sp.]RPG14154.1 MAG: DUF3106 domain-containing protein [Proteobacteria bacterium TMED72]